MILIWKTILFARYTLRDPLVKITIAYIALIQHKMLLTQSFMSLIIVYSKILIFSYFKLIS